MKDFFISYSSLDESWAEWVAWEVEAAGYSTMLQKWDFTPGKNFALEMNEATRYSQRIILVLSENFLLSDFTRPEWAAFFALDPTGEKGAIVPIRIEECHPSGLLGQIVYIDFVGLNERQCRERLIGGLRAERKKPSASPSFPGVDAATTAIKPRFPEPEREEKRSETRGDLIRLVKRLERFEREGKSPPVIHDRSIGRAVLRDIIGSYVHKRMVDGPPGKINMTARYVHPEPQKVSFLVLDVDGMSGINKRFGIEVGDLVVKTLGDLTTTVSGRTLSGRFGDDTFFLILANTDLVGALAAGQALVDRARTAPWRDIAAELYVTCSASAAEFSMKESPHETITRAAQGVRIARDSGGNRVVRAPRFLPRHKIVDWKAILS